MNYWGVKSRFMFIDMDEEEILQSIKQLLDALTATQIPFAKFCVLKFPTLYQLAISKRYSKVVKVLLQHGVNIDLLL